MSIVVEHIVSFIVRHQHKNGGILLKTHLTSGAFFVLASFLFPLSAFAQTPDTLRRERLDEVEISAQRTPSEMRTATPTQVLDAENIEKLGALQLSDAIKQMAGVTLKDYGGVGGIKTVSARGLGSQFSTITIDGIPVDDSQNGQVDLGRYTLGNAAYISLSQGQEQSPLLSARAYAAGSTLNMETAIPSFWPGEHIKLKAGLEGGSFGFLSPTLLWQQWWNKKLRSSFYVNYLRSDGDYPFTLYYTASHTDSSSVERRRHSAVWMLTADGNLFYTIAPDNTLMVKAHYMRGEHQLPGPVHFYSQALSNENTREEVAFLQAKWKMESGKWKTQVLGKFQTSYDFYEDSSSSSITGYLFNEYRQREGYLSAATTREFHLSSFTFDLNLAVDGDLSHLESNLSQRNDVTRAKIIAVAATNFQISPFTFHLNVVYNDIRDRVSDLDTMPRFQRLSPYLSAMYALGEGTTLRLFYKETFRTPSFGELYFFQSLPRNLRPECAHQLNLGITHSGAYQPINLSTYQLTLDAYYNRVTDKIVARPGHNMYYWSMENLGTVDIIGVDATANVQFSIFNFQLNYSFQHAVDHSQPGSKVYGHQIIYTPRHSGGASLRWEHPWVNLGATAMIVGERYSGAQNSDATRLPAYCDIGLSADRTFDLRLGTLTLRASLLNLFDTQYEVVRSYPMMGRNWRLAVIYDF
ncbi:MAG: TonB-dependent receptor [Bacteroidales bacterium]|nr:TonB-dependent receptor [Bacteroidales bacterium]